MPRFFLVLLLSGILTSLISAEPISLELDFDGILGNGPDMVNAQPGDTLAVDVWFSGTWNLLLDIQIGLCTNPTVLYLSGFGYADVSPYSCSQPDDKGDGCWTMRAIYFSTISLSSPCWYGRAYYAVASDNSCSWITIDPALSYYTDLVGPTGTTGLFENNTPAGVLVNTAEDCFTTGTQESNWGEIKTLFR